MRWIVLALALGAAIMSLIHGVFEILSSSSESMAGLPLEAPGGAFTGFTIFLLVISAMFALAGGVMAFNRRRAGGVFLLAAFLICFFAHPNVRYYGVIYALGGAITFFLRRGFEDEDYDEYGDETDGKKYKETGYDDSEEDEDEEEEEEDYGDDDEVENRTRGRSAWKRKRESRPLPFGVKGRVAKIKSKEEYGGENLSKLNDSLKGRSSKVCPSCGATVGIDHKFCYNCGVQLHTASPWTKSASSYDLSSSDLSSPNLSSSNLSSSDLSPSPLILSVEEENQEENRQEKTPVFSDFQPAFPSDAPPGAAAKQKAEWDARQEDLDEEGEEEEEAAILNEEEDIDARKRPERETSHPRKVVVKPAEDDQPVVRRPLIINPDRSYREFSDYTRRRKRRRRSWSRRVAGLAVLALAVSGSAWFLLGMRRGFAPEPPPILDPIPEDPMPPIYPVEPESPLLPEIQIASPTRGVVVGTNVNVRPDHSVSGAVVIRLGSDARVDVLGSWEGTSGSLTGTWYRIRTGGREGWIYGQYLQALDERESTLPEGYTSSLLKSFGSSKENLTRELGQPTRQTATTLTWTGLTANFRGDTEITRLQITTARHVLLNGATVGMTDEALYRNVGYPSDYKSGQLRYIERGSQGMSVRMQNGRVQGITVGNI
jgi:hypothetical protein